MSAPAPTAPTGEHVHAWMPDGPPRGVVVLQHGLAEHAGRYVTDHGGVVGRLTGMGPAVYAMDLRGHRLSPGRRRVVDVRGAVRAHVGLRRHAEGHGVPVVALGHSLGGLVTAGSFAAAPTGSRAPCCCRPRWCAGCPPRCGWARVTGHAHSVRLPGLIGDAATLLSVEGGHHELLHDTDGDATLERVLVWTDARVGG